MARGRRRRNVAFGQERPENIRWFIEVNGEKSTGVKVHSPDNRNSACPNNVWVSLLPKNFS